MTLIPQQGGQHKEGHPPHEEVDPRGDPPGRVDPQQGHHGARQGHRPDGDEHGDAAVVGQGQQTDGGIGAGDEEVDGDVVVLPEGDPPGHAGVEAVVEGAGGVEADHAQAVDEEGRRARPAAPLLRRPQQQQSRPQDAQGRPHPVGDGRPGPQAVVGVSPLLPPDPGSLLPLRPRHGEDPIFDALIHAAHPAFASVRPVRRSAVRACDFSVSLL